MISNKRVLLLYPPVSKFERYSSEIGNAGGEQIPLGIYYIASFLSQYDYQVSVVDGEATHLNIPEILKKIKIFNPTYIGISSTTAVFHRALESAKAIKKEFPDKKIILGGPHISSNVLHAMSFQEFDYGVIGEGEAAIKELLDALIEKKQIDDIKGLTFRNKNKEIIITPKREGIANLDILPFPAYDLINDISIYTPPPSNYKTLPVINMITSRGCPSQCTFCDRSVFGEKYRQRSAQNIVNEIKYLKQKYGVREIAFVDDTFMLIKKRIFEIFELLDHENIHFYWTCMSRINIMDYEFLKYIKSKGCWHISFGIESGDENILKIIRKNISFEKTEQVIKWCHELGIKTKGFFIIGHPGETLETINKTIKFACKLKLDDIVVTINTPIPGSEQHNEAAKYGTLDYTDWSQWNYWRPVFVPHGLSKEIVLKKHREIYRKFYLRPRILFRYAMSFIGKGGWKRFKMVFGASMFMFKKSSL